MSKRFRNRLYLIQRIGRKGNHLAYIENDDGTLFSGNQKTKIKPEDLPKWYIYGRYYKCFGYLSAKGITDMVYIPNKIFNHFLKDDCLLIAYGGKITEKNDGEYHSRLDLHEGFDERVWGSEIVSMLKGARKYSEYDITPFIEQIRDKWNWVTTTYPNEFGPARWNCDVDALFEDTVDEQ